MLLLLLTSAWIRSLQLQGDNTLGAGDPVVVELRSDDPVLAGHGPSHRFLHSIDFSGTVYASARSDAFPPLLRLENEQGEQVQRWSGSDARSTCVELDVEPGQRLAVIVAASDPGAAGEVELQLVRAPDTAATRRAAQEGRLVLGRLEPLSRADPERCRKDFAAWIASLQKLEGGEASSLLAEHFRDAGRFGRRIGAGPSALLAMQAHLAFAERVAPRGFFYTQEYRRELASTAREFRELELARTVLERALAETDVRDLQSGVLLRRELAEVLTEMREPKAAAGLLEAAFASLENMLPPDHPDVLAMELELARVLRSIGDVPGARALLEAVVAARVRSSGSRHAGVQEARFELVRTLADSGDRAGARAVLGQIREAYSELPRDHPERVRVGQLLFALQDDDSELASATPPGSSDLGPSTPGPPASAYPPQLVVVEPDGPRCEVKQRSLLVRAVVTDPLQVRDVRLEQDGLVLWASELRGALRLEPDGRSAKLQWRVDVPESACETHLRLRAVNSRGLESEEQEIVVRFAPAQRDLYVLAVGVSDYEQDALDLRYPVRDVEDLTRMLATQQGKLYEHVYVEVLTDAVVSSAAVRKARHEFLGRARAEDTLIVFFAGHGLRTPDGEYYFLTPSCTEEEPYGGVERGELESLILSPRLRASRRLLLIDSCFAGASLAAEATRGEPAAAQSPFLQREVDRYLESSSTGLYVLAATTELGLAREVDGNGMFTRALLEGLGGAADKNENGLVEVGELKDFVTSAVRERSAGRQLPTCPRVSGEDFALARLR